MNINEDNKLYFEYLKTLKEKDLNSFIEDFKKLSSYPAREQYLKEFFSVQLIDILIQDDFIKCFYVDSQAKHISNKLKIDDIDTLKTLVYCYNVNSRNFKKAKEQKDFESKMEQEGFKRISPEQKEYDRKKVICFTDILKIGILDSNLKRELVEGTLLYSESHKSLTILPKGKRTKGFLIRDYAYIKEIK
jgi:hypothetical protein